MKSKRFKLNKREVLKGIALAFIGGMVAFVSQNTFNSFAEFNWQAMVMFGVKFMGVYLGYTFFENDK